MYGNLTENPTWKLWNLYSKLKPGLEVWTPGGKGTVAGKHTDRTGIKVIVDHGVRVDGVVITVAYPIERVDCFSFD